MDEPSEMSSCKRLSGGMRRWIMSRAGVGGVGGVGGVSGGLVGGVVGVGAGGC